MAARQVVVLDAVQDPTGVMLTITFVAWLTAPATRVIPRPTFTSSVPPVAQVGWGVTTTELAALQGGSIVERVDSVVLATANLTTAQCQAAVAAKYASLQATLTAQVFSSVHFVGASWDGTTWAAGP